jgi:PGF-pre-PGF domain-containing protein
MVLSYYSILQKNPIIVPTVPTTGTSPDVPSHQSDYGYYVSGKYTYNGETYPNGANGFIWKDSETLSNLKQYLVQHDLSVNFIQTPDQETAKTTVRNEIDQGHPVIARTYLTGCTEQSCAGHYAVIVGYVIDSTGNLKYIVNDPFGGAPYHTPYGDYIYETPQPVQYTYDDMQLGASSRGLLTIHPSHESTIFPAANFIGIPVTGNSPLTVEFTDTSTGSQSGWAWFFGDETYSQTWTQQTGGAGWSGRYIHSSVVLPDGSILLLGGTYGNDYKNDVWRSTDEGTTWSQQKASAEWSGRFGHSSVVLPDSSVVLMGGSTNSGKMNDVWRSADKGISWTKIGTNVGWSARDGQTSVVMQDGSIILMGGRTDNGGRFNDVWRSTDKGATWLQQTASAGWTPRYGHTCIITPDNSIILMGGFDSNGLTNDVWKSTDNGVTWTKNTANAVWPARYMHTSVVMPDGNILLMGGVIGGGLNANDIWKSADSGISWTKIGTDDGWDARNAHTSVVIPDGSIVLMGGSTNNGNKNDVWRLNPVGSSTKNPAHTYSTTGTYPVTLQVYNAEGFNSLRKAGYITVTAPKNEVWIQQNSSRYTIVDDRSVVNAQGGYSEMNPGIQLKNLPFSAVSPIITNLNNYDSGDNTVRIFDYHTNGFSSITLPERSQWSSGSNSVVAIPKQSKTYLFSLQEQSGGGTSGCPKTVTIASIYDYPDISGSSIINLEVPITAGCPWVDYSATLDGEKIYALVHSDKKYLYEIDLTSSKYETLNSVFTEHPLSELPDDLPMRYPSYIYKLTDTTYLFYQYQGSEVYSNILYNSASKSWIEFPDYGKNYARMIWHQKKDNYFYALFSQSDSYSIYPYRMMRIDLQNLNNLNSNSQLFENYWSSRQVINKYGAYCDDGTIMHRAVPCSPLYANPLIVGDTLYSIEQYSSVRPYDTELGNITSINLWTGTESTNAINRLYNSSSATLSKILYPQQKVSIISPVVVNTTAQSLYFVNTSDIVSLLSLKQNEYSQCYVIGEDDVKTNLLCTYWDSSTKNQRFTAIDVSYEPTGSNPNTPSAFSPGSLASPGSELVTITPEFSWPAVTGADGYGLYIRDMDSNTLVFDSRSRGISIVNTKYSLPKGILEKGRKYRWNMNAHTTTGWGTYSDRLYFQAPAPATILAAPTLVSPSQDISILTPDFKWQAVPGADKYGLYISDITNGENNGEVIFSSESWGSTITGTNYTLPSKLNKLFHDGGNYRWNMRAFNSDGPGSYSQTLSFQTPAINNAQIPIADFTISPDAPTTYQDILLDASRSKAADGSRIVHYSWSLNKWNWGFSESSSQFKDKITEPGHYDITLLVTDEQGRVSLPKTYQVDVKENPNIFWGVTISGPEKTSNYETKHYTINITNLIPDENTGQIVVKLTYPQEYTITKQSENANKFYFNDKRVLKQEYSIGVNQLASDPKTEAYSNNAYWIVDNIYPQRSKEITFEVQVKQQSKEKIPDLFLNVEAKKISKLSENAFYPGIGWRPPIIENNKDGKDRLTRATDLNAKLINCLYGTNDKTKLSGGFEKLPGEFDIKGALHTWLASLDYPTDENLLDSSEGNGNYHIVFSHSGGTQILYQKLKDKKVITDYAFFAAPALITQDQMVDLIKSGAVKKKIFIVQSTQDILYNTHIRDFQKKYDFSSNIFVTDIRSGVKAEVAGSPLDEWGRNFAKNWLTIKWNYIDVDPLLKNIDKNQLPDEASFWIGGSNRDNQELFQPSYLTTPDPNQITVINLEYNGLDKNPFWIFPDMEVHGYLIDWIIEQYNTGGYPFDGSTSDLKAPIIPEQQRDSKIINYAIAHDPNEKTGPEGHYPADQILNYKVEYENEGDGTAYNVSITDALDSGLDETTLEISPVYSVATGHAISERGIYFPENRTVFWDIGAVLPGEGGYSNISVKFSPSAPDGMKIVNYATVYFPSAFEETKTNSVVTIKGVNLPPDTPNLTYPEPNVNGIPANGTLYWSGHEPNNETLMYDVYLGLTTPPPRVLENTSYEYYSFSTLAPKTTYYWKIVAKDPYGAETSSAIQQFTITSEETLPSTNFTANITSGPAPLTVAFNDTSSNTPTSWAWDFNNDGTVDATTQNATYTYTSAGTYTVNLTATNSAGSNMISKIEYVTVSGITGSDPFRTILKGEQVFIGESGLNMTDLAPTGSVISWYPSGANIANPSSRTVRIADSNNFAVSPGNFAGYAGTWYIGNPPASSSDVAFVVVDPAINVMVWDADDDKDVSGTTVPAGHRLLFRVDTNAYSAASRQFVGDSSGFVGINLTDPSGARLAGVYNMSVSETNSKSYNLKKQFLVNMNPWYWGNGIDKYWNTSATDISSARIYPDGTYTVGTRLFLNNISDNYKNNGADYLGKTYTVTTITIGPAVTPPVAAFNANPVTGTAPLAVQFNDTSSNMPTSWSWDFNNDGTIDSMTQNATYTYTRAGTYTVNLTATNSAGSNTVSKTKYITVTSGTVAPVAAFGSDVTTGAAPLMVKFLDISENEPTSWLWDFGDGSTSTVQNATHTYTAAGSYAVNLTVTNAAGMHSSRLTDFVTVTAATPSPVAFFTSNVQTGTAPLTVQFTDQSTGTPTTWHWDFGDNSSTNATVQNPVHSYAANGNYTVNLTVANAAGSSFHVTQNYVIVGTAVTPTVTATPTPTSGTPVIPVAAFKANKTEGDKPLAVKFTDQSTNTPTSWYWDFGDSSTSAEQNPVHTFSSTSTYTVSLKAANAAGNNTATKSGYITVIAPVVQSNTFAVSNVTTTTSAGVQNVTIDTTGGNVTTSGNVVTISNTTSWSSLAITLSDPPATGGTTVNGTVETVKATTEPVTAPIASVGTPTVQIALNMSAMPGTTSAITQTITKDPDTAAQTSFSLFASSAGKQIDEIAYTLNVQKTNLANAGDGGIIQSATLTMTVSKTWVDAHGGTSALAVLRRADDGITQILTPTVTGPDSSGNYLLTIISPSGLSTFSVASVSAVSSGSSGSTSSVSGSYTNNGDTDTGTYVSSSSKSTAMLAPVDPSSNPWTTQTVNGPTHITRIDLQPIGSFGKDFFLLTEQPASLPKEIPSPGVPVYEFHKIDLYHATSDDVNQAKIEFAVSPSYLDSQKMTYRDVQLYRYHDKTWEKLPTEYLGMKDGSHLYRATTPGFSYFATVLVKDATIVTATTTAPTPALRQQVTTTPAAILTQHTVVPTVVRTQAAPPVTPAQEPAFPLPMLMGVIAGIVILCLAVVTARKWHIRKQNPGLFQDEPFFGKRRR